MKRLIASQQLSRMLGDWRAIATRGASYERLASALLTLIADGRLAPELSLPAERELARELGISRTTTKAAYDHLRSSGYLESRQGSGTWVTLPSSHSQARAWVPGEANTLIDLSMASPDPPVRAIRAALDRAITVLPAHLRGHGYNPLGLSRLRETIAAKYEARGLPTKPEQIIVTAGAQAAIQLIADTLLRRGDPVVIEIPTYPNALDALSRAGGRLLSIGVSAHGWDVDMLIDAVQRSPRLAYLIPDFHNPTGQVLGEDERRAIPEIARRHGTYLVVDEILSDLVLDKSFMRPCPVAAFDTGDRVLSIGSLSKTVWGGLRVGWIRSTPTLVAQLAAARAAVDIASPVLGQLVAAEVLADLEAILQERRDDLRQRRDTLHSGLLRAFPQWRAAKPAGGLSIWVEMDQAISSALTIAAEGHGVRLVPGPRFGMDGILERFLRIPFVLPEGVLVEAVQKLQASVRDIAPARQASAVV